MSSYEQPPPQQAAKVAFIAAAPAAAAATAAIATASAAHQATSTHHHAFAIIDNAAYVRSQLGLDEGMTLPQQDSDLNMHQSINRSVHLSISINTLSIDISIIYMHPSIHIHLSHPSHLNYTPFLSALAGNRCRADAGRRHWRQVAG